MQNNNYFYIHRITPPHDATRINVTTFEAIRPLFKSHGNALKLYTILLGEKPYDFRGYQDEIYCTDKPFLLTRKVLHGFNISKLEFHSNIITLLKLGYLTQRNVNTFDLYEAPFYRMEEMIATTPDHFTKEQLEEHQSILNGTWQPPIVSLQLVD